MYAALEPSSLLPALWGVSYEAGGPPAQSPPPLPWLMASDQGTEGQQKNEVVKEAASQRGVEVVFLNLGGA